MGDTDHPLGLDNPGFSLRLIAKVRDNPTAPVGLRHLDADAPVLLPNQPVYLSTIPAFIERPRLTSTDRGVCRRYCW